MTMIYWDTTNACNATKYYFMEKKRNWERSVIEVPNFITQVPISKKRRTKYYKKGVDKLPKKYEKKGFRYVDGFLVDSENTKMISNPRVAGKPRFHKISGQEVWSGIDYNLRSKIGKEMKKYFYDKLKSIQPLMNEDNYPVGIRIDIHDLPMGEDLDNQIYLYRKTIHDALCGNVEFIKGENGKFTPDHVSYPPIIIDDSKKYVQDIPTTFYEVKTPEERKLVIEIYRL